MEQKKTINDILFSVHTSRSLTGRKFFMEAVELAANDMTLLPHIQKNIYTPIANNNGTNAACVAKAIKRICDKIMKHGGIELLEDLSQCPIKHSEAPYPKEIIEVFAMYLNRQ